jgi:hypothetical protein
MPPFRSICGGQLMGLIRHTPVCWSTCSRRRDL